MYKRDMADRGRMLFGEWTQPEFEFLKDNQWVFTEKVDGTNIRVIFDGEEFIFAGKTDNAQLHCDLIKRIQELFQPQLELFKETFPVKEDEAFKVCFYGEGYGAGIQKGGCYKETKDFVLFDIKIGDMWLQRPDVEELAKKFGLDIVPIVGKGTLEEGVELVKKGFKSQWGDFIAEGIVTRPATELRTRRGERIITKIKHCDFGAKE
jgi:ATP-dependent RNA circularization protein (DNA/RNA ligase family)